MQTYTKELSSINLDVPKNIEKIISFIKDANKESSLNALQNQIEEYKKLIIAKDSEISKLNDINSSKQNEIDKLKTIIEEQKKGTREHLLEEEIKLEKEKLNSKINDLELKIYNLNDEKNKLIKENKILKDQIDSNEQGQDIKKENDKSKLENNDKEIKLEEKENKGEKTRENDENKEENINEEIKLEDKENNNEKNKDNEEEKINENNEKEKGNNIKDNIEIEYLKKEKEDIMNKYEQIIQDKQNLEEEKNRLLLDNNYLKERNEILQQEQKNLEEILSKLKSENNKLKEDFNNNEIKLKTYMAKENLNNQDNNNDDLYLTKLNELDELKLKITKYETGEIISNIIKEKIDKEKLEHSEKEKNYIQKIKDKEKRISEYISKIKQNEAKIKTLSEKLLGINQEKGELENIVLKQESRVGKLGEKVDKIELLLKNKNEEIRENENYSLKLINIIKEQKHLILNLKKEQKNMEENYSTYEENLNTINSLKAQITALKKKIDIKEESFQTLQKSHKVLQEKYLKSCSNNRKKEQEILLKQAKRLKADKIQREKEFFLEKNKKLFELKKELIEKNYSSLNDFKPKKLPSSAYKNKKEEYSINFEENKPKDDNKSEKSIIHLGPVLPMIKSSKNKERIEKLKIKNEDDGKLEEISDMMNNILNEL